MKTVERIVASILLLIWMSATIFLSVLLFSPGEYRSLTDTWLTSEADDFSLWRFIAMLALFLLLQLWLLLRIWRSDNLEADAVMHATDVGSIHISLDTIRTVCLKIGHKIRGVRELYVRIKHSHQGGSIVLIGLKVIVDGERPIKELTEELQTITKTKVEQICGVSVDQVAVYVVRAEHVDKSKIRSI